mmetsp:Transcript_10573/g.27996  ORF Transcript_10573/g.27996 Transcript_10573/m.27996 type:complete len:207 (+) Transcript_10573:1896-2516(+)
MVRASRLHQFAQDRVAFEHLKKFASHLRLERHDTLGRRPARPLRMRTREHKEACAAAGGRGAEKLGFLAAHHVGRGARRRPGGQTWHEEGFPPVRETQWLDGRGNLGRSGWRGHVGHLFPTLAAANHTTKEDGRFPVAPCSSAPLCEQHIQGSGKSVRPTRRQRQRAGAGLFNTLGDCPSCIHKVGPEAGRAPIDTHERHRGEDQG